MLIRFGNGANLVRAKLELYRVFSEMDGEKKYHFSCRVKRMILSRGRIILLQEVIWGKSGKIKSQQVALSALVNNNGASLNKE